MLVNLTTILSLIYFINFVNGQVNNQGCCEDYCFKTDDQQDQVRHFSTKTAYQIVKGSQLPGSELQFNVPHCTAVKFWLISRHGTRLPSAKSMKKLEKLTDVRDEILENYEKRRSKPDKGQLCEEDMNLFRNWTWDKNATGAYDEYLTAQGWEDLKFLARSYIDKFPNVISQNYSSGQFLFRHTDTQRTEASYKAFVEGLFGDGAYNFVKAEPIPDKDYLLRPYDQCEAWDKQEDSNDDSDSELSKFMASDVFKNVCTDISTRLGFKFTLGVDVIENIWDMCRFEQAWFLNQPSPWCAAITPDQVYVLEYKEDLKYFYKSGHGHKLNERIACAGVKDMLTQLEYSVGPSTIAYFTHSSMLQLFLVALGAQKDALPLRADNFYQQQNRKWRTSTIGPFATNVAAIKYECPDQPERYKIAFFLNEIPLQFDWCDVGLCDWSVVKEKYKFFQEADCAKEYCDLNSSIRTTSSGIIILLAIWLGIGQM